MKREIIQLNLNDIKLNEHNPRTINKRQLDKLVKSVQEFPEMTELRPIVVDENNTILGGNMRYRAMQKLGYKQAEVVKVSGLTDEQKREFIIKDNVAFGEWDWDALANEWDMGQLNEWGLDIPEFEVVDQEVKEVKEDEAPEVKDGEPKAKMGDIYQLGRHRLMCGDSTDVTVIDRLMDGVKADMVFTDPPYNIASDSKNFAADVSKAMKNLSESEWDKNFDIREALDNILASISENATVYVCTSHFLASDIWAWMKEWADHYSYCVWSKPNPMPSLSKRHWTWNTELICYATRGKHTFNFPKEGHALSTWTINKINGKTGHPTEKPVEVPAMAISHSSKENDVVLDLFGGSGSTLIACEQLNRKCYMMELDPHYVDVIIQRWENFTGKKAEKIN